MAIEDRSRQLANGWTKKELFVAARVRAKGQEIDRSYAKTVFQDVNIEHSRHAVTQQHLPRFGPRARGRAGVCQRDTACPTRFRKGVYMCWSLRRAPDENNSLSQPALTAVVVTAIESDSVIEK